MAQAKSQRRSPPRSPRPRRLLPPRPHELRIRDDEEFEEGDHAVVDDPIAEPPAPGLAWIQLSGPPIALPEVPRSAPSRPVITTSDGTLYAIVGEPEDQALVRWPAGSEADPVWRKPPDGAWERVPLPPFRSIEPSTPWVHAAHRVHRDELDRGTLVYGWEPYEARDYDTTFVSGMAWAAGAIWVTVAQHDDVWFRGPPRLRTMLLTTLQGEGEPVVLPPSWQLQLERRNERARTAALGSRDCRTFSLVVGPASLAPTQPELVRALRAMPRAGRGKLGPIYVGELDGSPRLVAYARAPTVDAAHALRDAASAATGLDVTTDCRVPLVDTMVSRGRSK